MRVTEKVTVEPWFAVCDELPTAVRTGGTGEEEAIQRSVCACILQEIIYRSLILQGGLFL